MEDYGDTEILRINVVGTSGSGKSTFCQRLSKILSIPHIEMDAVFWGPNWHWPSDEEFFAKLKKELNQDAWILDGNYTRTIPLKWERVQLVIWLDYSFRRTLFQAIKRALVRSLSKQELWAGTGNRESLKRMFSKDSIILWTIKTHKKVRVKYERLMTDEAYSHIEFVRLRSPEEAEDFLSDVSCCRLHGKVVAEVTRIQ